MAEHTHEQTVPQPPSSRLARPRRRQTAILVCLAIFAVSHFNLAQAASDDPIWGCESPALPADAHPGHGNSTGSDPDNPDAASSLPGPMHLVVSTLDADPEQLLPWIWHLGLTNAHIFIYHRLNDSAAATALSAAYASVRPPCNMSLTVRQLLPNKGREAAVFLHHLVAHYEQLPEALALVHDHGPASRHSLCGPFYRRLRGYYKGLAARPVNASDVYHRFSRMVVTLSSGCTERWAGGCGAGFLCSGSRDACPFLPRKRPHHMAALGMYDARYENVLVGEGGGGVGAPVALVRYAGRGHRSSGMWNISTEYPPGQARLGRNETIAALEQLLARHGFARPPKGEGFRSCCASLVLRSQHVRRWPVELYRDLLSYATDPRMDYEATKAVSGPGWALWTEREYGTSDMYLYMKVDVKLRALQGCPAATPPVRGLLAAMRAAGGQGGGAQGAGAAPQARP